MKHDRAMFRSTVATADLPRDGGVATLADGLPDAIWSVTGSNESGARGRAASASHTTRTSCRSRA